MNVSRETGNGAPGWAGEIFGARLALAERFAEKLATDGVERGLIGPRERERIWDRHIRNCVAGLDRVPEFSRVADVGSGAGLPGVVWAILRPDLTMTLIEPMLRRTVFLEEVVSELSLTNASVLRGRAEELDLKADIVTARAVARLDKLARWCLPMLVKGGKVLALKGARASEELEECRSALKELGVREASVIVYEQLGEPTRLVEVCT